MATVRSEPAKPSAIWGMSVEMVAAMRLDLVAAFVGIRTGIGLMTPDQVHYGQAETVYAARQQTLDRACRKNPQRFVNKPPTAPTKPTAAWINRKRSHAAHLPA